MSEIEDRVRFAIRTALLTAQNLEKSRGKPLTNDEIDSLSASTANLFIDKNLITKVAENRYQRTFSMEESVIRSYLEELKKGVVIPQKKHDKTKQYRREKAGLYYWDFSGKEFPRIRRIGINTMLSSDRAKRLYDLYKERGKVKREDVMSAFGVEWRQADKIMKLFERGLDELEGLLARRGYHS